MSAEDRLRAAARARTNVVSSVRPLELPDEMPAPVRRNRHTSRWLSWGAPIAAAALVTAVALSLVLLRQAGGQQPRLSAPASGSTEAASIPRYYVELAYAGSTSDQMKAIVGDDRTGRKIAVLNPTASQNFYGLTAAADDRTFVVMNYAAASEETTWYLLRIAPGTAHPARMVKLPIKPLVTHVSGLALSPDGRELAVMWRTATTQSNAVSWLAVYSVSSGAPLATWVTYDDNENLIGGPNEAGLSWVDGDRGLDFRWAIPPRISKPGKVVTPGKLTVRAVDVTAGRHDLLADSRVVMQVPRSVTQQKTRTFTESCPSSLAAPDGTVVCGTTGGSWISGEEGCQYAPPSFVSYAAATGKQLKVLYRYQGQCLNGQSLVLWTDPSGSHAIALLLLAVKGVKASASDKFGVVSGGRFTPLPALIVPRGAVDSPGGIAF